MGGETEAQVSGWTTDTLKAYVGELTSAIEREIAALDRRLADIRDADQKAIAKAEVAAEAARVALRSEAVTWKQDHNNLIEQLAKQSQQHGEMMVRMAESMASKEAVSSLSKNIDDKLVLRASGFNDRIDAAEKALEARVERLDKFQNRLAGGMVVVAMIGVTNLVKVWTG
jgi:ParB-like chromosome segregation protein Spo0J